MDALFDAAATANIHTVIRTLAIAVVALALLALVPGRALFRPWHVRTQRKISSWRLCVLCCRRFRRHLDLEHGTTMCRRTADVMRGAI